MLLSYFVASSFCHLPLYVRLSSQYQRFTPWCSWPDIYSLLITSLSCLVISCFLFSNQNVGTAFSCSRITERQITSVVSQTCILKLWGAMPPRLQYCEGATMPNSELPQQKSVYLTLYSNRTSIEYNSLVRYQQYKSDFYDII